jgi:hypothetical protein
MVRFFAFVFLSQIKVVYHLAYQVVNLVVF